MSHFSVLVIGEDVDKQLDPFWELDLSQENIKKDPRGEFEVKIAEGELKEAFEKWISDQRDFESKHPDTKKYSEKYNTPNLWVDDYHNYSFEPGKGWGYWGNPNAKWDWYSVGGRWRGFFKLKKHATGTLGNPGTFNNEPTYDSDSALKKDIDFEFMERENAKSAEREWMGYERDCEVKKKKRNGRNIITETEKPEYDFNSPEAKEARFMHGVKEGETKEQYIKRNSGWSTFAVLKDGKWFEKGQMGWWALVSNEKSEQEWQDEFTKLVSDLPDDTLLTLVDCHI